MGFFDTSYDALPLTSTLNTWLDDSSSTGEWCTKDFYYINNNDEVDCTDKMLKALEGRLDVYTPVISIYNHLPVILKFSDNIKKFINIRTVGFIPSKEDFDKGLNIKYISNAESLKDVTIKVRKNITFDSVKNFENIVVEYNEPRINEFNSFAMTFIKIDNIYNVLNNIKIKSDKAARKYYIFDECDICKDMLLTYKKDPIEFEAKYKRILDITKTNAEITIKSGEKRLNIRYLPNVDRFWYFSY